MKARRPNRRDKANHAERPSLFFLIALAIGLLVVAYLFVLAIRRPMGSEQPLQPTTTERTHVAHCMRA